MNQALLNLESIRFAWPGQSEPVIDIQALSIGRGERVYLHGPSGSGKSTLLALIAGLIRPQSGLIACNGLALKDLSGRKRDRFRADYLGIIFQQFNLLPWLDVKANVILPCRFSRRRAERAGDPQSAAAELLEAMDLESALWHRRADNLSVGQQQRVAAARALIGQPSLVLADEPTSALDADRRDRFLDLLFDRIDQAGSALLFVSHDRELARRFDRTLDLTTINRRGAGP